MYIATTKRKSPQKLEKYLECGHLLFLFYQNTYPIYNNKSMHVHNNFKSMHVDKNSLIQYMNQYFYPNTLDTHYNLGKYS